MKADKSWVAGVHETAKMSSILGLPTQGTDITIFISKVHLHPLCVLVEFWGQFSHEKTIDYKCLAEDIQSPGNIFQEFEGNPGEQCLVQIDGTWYRSRIVSRNGSKYSVFLIDKGTTVSTTISKLAWGIKKYFHLPPEVEFCVLANVLPLSPENRWSPVALEFLRSLSGKSVMAHVQDVLVSHRTFILHIPCISKQMYEMGIAKKLPPNIFQDFVLTSLQSQSGAQVSPESHQISAAAGERLHKQELFMYPELQTGTVETVIVTDVTNPQRIFCQLKVFSQELKKLSDQITQCCEGRLTNCIVTPEMIGFPCAARGSDGRWYRSVLQQVFPTNKVVEVLNVDYGTKQFVQVENVRPLAAEFFRMPVVTYVCSLHGTIDKGVGWTTNQIDYLRSLILYKTVIAKFEYQSISEGVHYVTLYGEENTNMNKLFDTKESCSLDCEKTLGDYAIRSTVYNRQHSAQQEKSQGKMISPGQAVEEKGSKGVVEKLSAEDLSLNSSHMAFVQHVSDPSEFWIQTQNYTNELDELMDSIYDLYKDSVTKDVVKNPTVGLYCAAKSADGDFYRATVAEVGETQMKVFFVDYGNTEVVDESNIRILPDKFKKLPCLALKCTLAGIRPKDGRWSQRASDIFLEAVKDKELNVHVAAKYNEGFVVQLTDPNAQGERDLSALMCSSGLAERAETQRQPKAKMTMPAAILPPTQLPDARVPSVYRNKGTSIQTLDKVVPAGNERRIPSFKEHMFPIGSVLDITVSYIDSPNDFWCQLVQNSGHLKLLMHDIQAYYAGSEFQPPLETACVARHPDNGMWYRALVIQKHETPHVDVLFVDYGQMETVSLYDLRRICSQFLTLPGQAFRCSLLNPVDPTSATNEWNEEAIARFHKFVETAASNLGILKCTIYAVMYTEQKILFNIVDLETPFESVSAIMVSLVESAPPKKAAAAAPSFRLDTYYYSTHNIKTGTEEQVTVSCVNNVSQFYCHLDRNTDVIKDLKIKVRNLCRQLENVKLPTVFGTLCFAKYTDGQWYRGQIKATKPAILVHFVDYGDTIEVGKSDLIPVPREANDIMTVPVQAVVCSLSDVPSDVSSEVNSWFETNVTDGKFRALAVAREPDGKLLVELYHGNTQINSKIKKMFQIEMHTEGQVVYHGQRAPGAYANHAERTPKAVPKQAEEIKDHSQTIEKTFSAPKPVRPFREADKNLQSIPKPVRHVCENGEKIKTPLELYRHPHQRQSLDRTTSKVDNGSEPTDSCVKPRKDTTSSENKQPIKSKPVGADSQNKNNVEILPKLADLPSKSISSGMEADVYVSHCNSPLSFYVQLVREEDDIFSIVEKLNDPLSTPKTDDIKDLHPGDFVQAEFTDDSSWYRAVVREIQKNKMALVEFVDFGNTAIMPVSKIARLHKSFLQLPMYSTHCMLSDAAALGEEDMLDPEVVSAFKEDIGGSSEKVLKCQFIRQSGSTWEVRLEDGGVHVMCKVATSDGSEMASEKLEQVKEIPTQNSESKQVPEDSLKSPLNLCSLNYHQQEFLEGEMLEVYIATTNDDQTFWCQPADTEELDKITSSVSDVGNLKHIDPCSLSPGSPCIALFSDDNHWYRAEVIDKDGDELSVHFVDYGNKSEVKVTDVREVTLDLIETTPQAFLCELEGFDVSQGSWDTGAIDELSALTTDKSLLLTVTKLTREEGKIRYLVQMECEGQVINEAMKTWWNSSTTVKKPAAVGLMSSSSEKETAPPEEQIEDSKSQELDTAVACVQSQRPHGEEQSTGKLQDPELASSPKNSNGSEDSFQSFAESPEKEGDQILPECNRTTGSLILSTTESLRENVLDEKSNIVPTTEVSQTTLSVVDNDKDTEEEDASVLDTIGSESPLDGNPTEAMDESAIATTDLESPSAEVNTYNMGSTIISFDPTEERDDSEDTIARAHSLASTTTVKMVPREAVHPGESIDLFETTTKSSEEQMNGDEIQSEVGQPSCVLSTSDALTEQEIEAVDGIPTEEDPCVTIHEKSDLMTEEETSAHHEDAYSDAPPEQEIEAVDGVPTEEVPSVTTHVEIDLMTEEETSAHHEDAYSDAPTEQEIEAVVGVPTEEVPSVTTHVESDLMTEEETLAHHEDAYTALPSDTDAAATEPHTCTAPLQHSAEEVVEVTFTVEEACLIDVCTDPNEASGVKVTGATDHCPSSVTPEEMVQNESLLPCSELPHEQLTEAPSEHEVQVGDISLQDEGMHNENNSKNGDETSALHEDEPSVLLSDTEAHAHTVPCPHLSVMVEEVTCLVRDICLTEICTDPQQESKTEDGEQLYTPPQQTEDLSDSVPEEETSSASSSSDDSFDAQWSKITHLSLLISEGSASMLPFEEQPEE